MDPEKWEMFAAKFGEDAALEHLGERPTAGGGPGVGGGLVRAGAQGATLGFADEGMGALSALGAMVPGGRSPGEAFRETVDSEREKIDQFREEHPVLSFGGEMVGGIVTGTGAGTLARKAGLAGARVARASLPRLLGAGAAAGGAAGAGAAEGGLKSRGAGALKGAAAGAAFAGGLRGLTNVAGAAGGRVLDATGARPRTSSGPVGAAASRAGIESADTRATRKVLEAAKRDDLVEETPEGLSFDQLMEARQSAEGKPVSILDLGDEEGNLIGLGRATKTLPGKAKKELSEKFRGRSQGELGRISDDLTSTTGIGREFTDDAVETIVQRRAQAAKPLYERAYAHGTVDDPEIQQLLTKPSIQRALQRAKNIGAEEGYPVPAITEMGGPPDVRTLDLIKRALDDVLYVGKRAGGEGGLGPSEARAIEQTRSALLSRLDEVVPDYAAARAQYAGDTALKNALEEGAQDFTRTTVRPEAIRNRIAAMTPGEQEMYRKGATDSLLGKLGDVMDEGSQARKLMRTPNMRDKVRLLFDSDEAADEFMARAGIEERMGFTKNKLLSGSRTAEVQAEQADLLNPAELLPTSLSRGGILRRLLDPLAEQLDARARGFSGKVSEELAQRFTAGLDNPQDLDQLIETLRLFAEETAERQAGANRRLSGAATAAGLGAGRSGG